MSLNKKLIKLNVNKLLVKIFIKNLFLISFIGKLFSTELCNELKNPTLLSIPEDVVINKIYEYTPCEKNDSTKQAIGKKALSSISKDFRRSYYEHLKNSKKKISLVLGGVEVGEIANLGLPIYIVKNKFQTFESFSKNLKIILNNKNNKITVNLSNNGYISDKCMSLFIEAIKSSKSLKTLNISNVEINEYKLNELLKDIKTTSIENLILCYNEVGFMGLKHICDAIDEKNCSLKKIDLFWNNIDNKCIKMLSSKIKDNKTVKMINLSRNNIGNKGVTYLLNLLKENKTIKCIDLSNNKFSSKAVKQIIKFNIENSNQKIKYKVSFSNSL